MANVKLGTKAVGSTVKLKVNGTAKEFIVVHQGKPSSIYDESCNGTWLLMKDIYENRQWHSSNVNNLENSTIHSYLNGTFLNLFDSDIKDAIKQVKLPYRAGGGEGGTTQQGANGLPCKIFLLSAPEVHYSRSYIASGEGAALSYFASCVTNNADPKRVAYLNGSAAPWWLRSPATDYIYYVWCVEPNGDCTNYSAGNSYGIRPALVLPPDMEVDSSGNVTPPPPPATHKTLVNGTAYEVTGGKCLVNGTAYSIKKGRTLIGGTGYDITFAPSYDPVFANNTWEQIIEACHNNEVPDTWKVADQKPMTINGKSYQIDIIDKNHDDYSDGSGKAPLTFQLHDCYGKSKNMNSSDTNNGGWTSCAMRSTHLPAILALMPKEVQNGIRKVNKLTSAGNQSATINTTVDKLFLLSEIEIFGSTNNSFSGEGTQYDYYKAGNSRVKNYNGSASIWWTRSPDRTYQTRFCGVGGDSYVNNPIASLAEGVAFGFCF